MAFTASMNIIKKRNLIDRGVIIIRIENILNIEWKERTIKTLLRFTEICEM